MSKTTLAFYGIVILANVIAVSAFAAGLVTKGVWVSVLSVLSGIALGNIIFYLFIEDWLDKKFKEE